MCFCHVAQRRRDTSTSCFHCGFLRLVLLRYVYPVGICKVNSSSDGFGFCPDSKRDVRAALKYSKNTYSTSAAGTKANK
ncbi:hypothetical protein PR003_g26948 [Phytophthora rubi]|uniref:Uncharacterized protein n=1 Tax=Phytophthora rubi TaxID=129364 RepID=A0A6A4CB82_9STRA|nr:hypothetical protein PR001_g22679 [Phytophthora rubi]KAE9284081.1 hypothetical protein PR003_g26948 [Phytophthora rubi]